MKTRIRCGVVGLGRISARHLEAIAHHPDSMELAAVCDSNAATLSAFSGPPGMQRFGDVKTMLAEAALDVVTVCTPSGLHPEHGIMIAEAGCHAVVEKPMATSWRDGLRLHCACEERKVKLFVVLQNRYNALVLKLKQAVDEGRFGKIYMIASNVFWARPQSYYDQAKWRGTWSLDGGAFMNQASHYVDLLCHLGGPVESVQAMIATLARAIEAEDTGAALIRFRSGALATLNVTMLAYPHNREGSLTLLGEKGYVRIGGTALNKVEAWDFAGPPQPGDACAASLSCDSGSVYGDGHMAFYRDVIHAIQNGAPPVIDGSEGLKSLELLAAIYDSARSQKAVSLPLGRE